MSFRLPLTGSAPREMMDLASVAEILSPANVMKLMPVWQARKRAFEAFAADPCIRRVCYIVLRADTDERWLVSFGRRGGWKKEWNFGTGRD